MSAVFESTTLAPTERLIMLALADHADDEGRCYPSIQRLCRRTGLSERAVQTNIKKLGDQGYVRIIRGGGKGHSNLYFVSANPASNAPKETPNPAADAPRRKCTPAADAPQTPQQMRLNPAADAPEPSGTIRGTVNSVVARASDQTQDDLHLDEKPKVKPKRAVALPEGWVPSEKNIRDAKEKNFTDEDIRNEADQFRDHHHARGSTFKDWDAAWRTWVRNAIKFRNRGLAGKAGPSGYGQGRSIASVVARRHSGG